MARRAARELRCVNGRFQRDLGWRVDADGKRRQPRFYLGTDEAAARLAELRLTQLYGSIEAGPTTDGCFDDRWEESCDRWTESTLRIAEAIRRGQATFAVPREDWMSVHDYLDYVQWHSRRYRGIAFIAEDVDAEARGRSEVSARLERLRQEVDEEERRLSDKGGVTVYQAVDAYAAFCRDHYKTKSDRIEDERTSDFGEVEAATALRLKRAHQDVPLSAFELESIRDIVQYYAARPPSRTHASRGKRRMAVASVIGAVRTLRRFCKWLDRNRATYQWRTPEGLDDACRLSRRKLLLDSELAAKKDGVPTYTVEELTVLYRYATPFERVFLLCGLNLAFSRSECRSFRWDEVEERDGRVYVRRVRKKTGVYGEFALWPETWEAIRWYRRQRAKESPWVLCGEGGVEIAGTRIHNTWGKLLARVRRDYPRFRRLSFKFLRKTAAQWMQECGAGGQTIRIFHCRGRPVEEDRHADAYYRRRFRRVFKYQIRMRRKLAPMFAACAEPFGPAASQKSYVSKGTLDKMQELAKIGTPKSEIALICGVSRATAYRRLGGSSGV
jgi:hypothetical protein